jgi:hypothetical protein
MGSIRKAYQHTTVSIHDRYRLCWIRARAYSEDDVVAILFGGKVPFVLRQTDNGMYKIVDIVYVDGIMGGEFLADRTSFTETTFVLR